MDTLDDIMRLRMKAEGMREIAEQATSPESRFTLFRLAAEYDLAANQAEVRAKRRRVKERTPN
jgi:hypothetical protein